MESTTKNYDHLSYDDRIELAIRAFESGELPSYKSAAAEFNVGRWAVSRRHQGKSTSRKEATSRHHKLLTDVEEEVLIDQINKLIVRFMPPTTQIVKNLAEEIIGRPVNKN